MIRLGAVPRRAAARPYQILILSIPFHTRTMPPKAPPPPPPPRASASTPATASIRGRLSNSKVLTSKRKANSDAHDPSISPPPTRRKIQSSVSNTVVASFFTPASQKPKAKKGPVAWEERAPAEGVPATLLVATFQPEGSRQGQDHDQKASESGGESEGESESKSKSKSKNKSASAPKRRKVAAFDLDSTLITTASGKKHAESATDWTWWDRTVPQRLRALHDDEGYAVVIFSNQGGLVLHPENSGKAASSSSSSSKASKSSKPKPGAQDRVADFKQKCAAVLTDLGLPVTLYAATGKDRFRKPRPGMWQEMVRDLGLAEGEVDLSESFFVGDAAGRLPYTRDRKMVPKDFSCSDRNLAANVGVRFETPEEYFLGEAPREYVRGFDLAEHPFVDAAAAAIEAAEEAEEAEAEAEAAPFKKGDGQELVVFCGPPGAGKSTFFRTHLEPLGFERVNQDTLKT